MNEYTLSFRIHTHKVRFSVLRCCRFRQMETGDFSRIVLGAFRKSRRIFSLESVDSREAMR